MVATENKHSHRPLQFKRALEQIGASEALRVSDVIGNRIHSICADSVYGIVPAPGSGDDSSAPANSVLTALNVERRTALYRSGRQRAVSTFNSLLSGSSALHVKEDKHRSYVMPSKLLAMIRSTPPARCPDDDNGDDSDDGESSESDSDDGSGGSAPGSVQAPVLAATPQC